MLISSTRSAFEVNFVLETNALVSKYETSLRVQKIKKIKKMQPILKKPLNSKVCLGQKRAPPLVSKKVRKYQSFQPSSLPALVCVQ